MAKSDQIKKLKGDLQKLGAKSRIKKSSGTKKAKVEINNFFGKNIVLIAKTIQEIYDQITEEVTEILLTIVDLYNLNLKKTGDHKIVVSTLDRSEIYRGDLFSVLGELKENYVFITEDSRSDENG